MTRALRRGIIEVPNSAEAHAALAQLNARLSRLESVRLVSNSVSLDATTRAVFVSYGAAILSSLDHPAASQTPESIQYGELRLLLSGFCDWLQFLKIAPRRIFCLEDFDSQIIARALAQQLNVDCTVAQGGDGFTYSKSLIVSADNRSLLAPPLRTIFPAQVLYSFNLHREGGAIVPDVSAISRAGLVLPWHDERLSARKVASVVERISTAPSFATAPDWQTRLEFYRSRRDLLTAGNSCYSRLSMLPETS